MFTGLIVAVMDHAHFRLKLLYKQKKSISAQLKDTKQKCHALEVRTLRIIIINYNILPKNPKQIFPVLHTTLQAC